MVNKLELQVFLLLEEKGWFAIKKGKGFDILAIRGNTILVIECKDWNREICGVTLRKIVRKLKKEYRKILQEFSGRTVTPILVCRNKIRDAYRTEPVLVFTFEEFKQFVANIF